VAAPTFLLAFAFAFALSSESAEQSRAKHRGRLPSMGQGPRAGSSAGIVRRSLLRAREVRSGFRYGIEGHEEER